MLRRVLTLLSQDTIFWSIGKKLIIPALLTLTTTTTSGRNCGLSPPSLGIKPYCGGSSREQSLLEESWANEVSLALLSAPDAYGTRKLLTMPSCTVTMLI
jgi:hypothetical protein